VVFPVFSRFFYRVWSSASPVCFVLRKLSPASEADAARLEPPPSLCVLLFPHHPAPMSVPFPSPVASIAPSGERAGSRVRFEGQWFFLLPAFSLSDTTPAGRRLFCFLRSTQPRLARFSVSFISRPRSIAVVTVGFFRCSSPPSYSSRDRHRSESARLNILPGAGFSLAEDPLPSEGNEKSASSPICSPPFRVFLSFFSSFS